jgi:urease gamma subunit
MQEQPHLTPASRPPAEAAPGIVHVGLEDRLTYGTMDGTNNSINTLGVLGDRYHVRRGAEGRQPMRLTPRELERLQLFSAAELARKRQARGVKLNYPEAAALLCDEIIEAARDGKTMAEAMEIATTTLRRADVMDGVADMLDKVQVEAMFTDGVKLVTVYDPIKR